MTTKNITTIWTNHYIHDSTGRILGKYIVAHSGETVTAYAGIESLGTYISVETAKTAIELAIDKHYE